MVVLKIGQYKDFLRYIESYLNNILQYTPFNQTELLLIAFFSSIIILLFLIISFKLSHAKIKKYEINNTILSDLVSCLNEATVSKKLTKILMIISARVEAGCYCFYSFNSKHNEFILKSILYQGEEESLAGPSYSGLLPFKKDSYNPPPSISIDINREKITEITEGSVTLLCIPILGGKAVIIAAPFRYISRSVMKQLKFISEKLPPVVDMILDLDNFKSQVETVVSSNNAVNCVSSIILDHKGLVASLMSISLRTLEASGGFFIEAVKGNVEIDYISGFDKDFENPFVSDSETHKEFAKMLQNKETVFISKTMPEYYKLPPYFSTQNFEGLLLVGIKAQYSSGIAGFIFMGESIYKSISNFRMSALLMLSKRMGDILNTQASLSRVSGSYFEILKMLSVMIDNLSPYTVGYSELMAHYSAIIAEEMKLPEKDINEICIAAFLSNIGVMALSNQLMTKSDKYSEVEYEIMKLHCEVGASIIESTVGNANIASYIRYHHERIDGFGYPEGLKDEAIPVGAKILAVSQTFLAKIIGRESRAPLPFENAIKTITSASNSHLDANVVDALIRWISKKQSNDHLKNSSLGKCYEMRCSPESICSTCDAFKATSGNCWDYGGKICAAHGNECGTCFIRTEYQMRHK